LVLISYQKITANNLKKYINQICYYILFKQLRKVAFMVVGHFDVVVGLCAPMT